MESSYRNRLNYMPEHRSILENNQNKYHPGFGFTLKTGIAFPKMLFFCFYYVLFRSTAQDSLFGPRGLDPLLVYNPTDVESPPKFKE